MEPQAILGRAERIVALARARGAHQAEAFLEWGEGLSVEVEKGALATTSASRSAGGSVRVVQDGRIGFAYFTLDEQAPAAIEAALRNTRFATVRGYSLPAGGKLPSMPSRWDADVAAARTADAVRLAHDLLAGARQAAPKALVSGGGVSLGSGVYAIASTEGVAVADRSTSVGCSAGLVLEDGERSISTGESASSHRLDLDAGAVGVKAGEMAMSLRQPRPAKAGAKFDIVLRPDATAEMAMEWMVSAATGDDAMRDKTVWSGKLGTTVTHAGLDLVDDPFAPGAIGSGPFDDEGLPVARLPIVEAGVLRSYLFDSWDAHLHGQKSTHSAVRDDFKSRPGTGTHQLILSSRNAEPMERLIGGVDRGFLVESVLGAHTANTTTGEFSVTSPNVWRIERGAVVGPVSDIAIAGNLPALLARADGTSREVKRSNGIQMPALRLRDVDVSV